MPLWLLLSADGFVSRADGRLDVELLRFAVGVVLCVDVKAMTPSPDEVIIEPGSVCAVLEAAMDSCTSRIGTVVVEARDDVEPPFVYAVE